jgi:predicted metalloprotease with PDZ domain
MTLGPPSPHSAPAFLKEIRLYALSKWLRSIPFISCLALVFLGQLEAQAQAVGVQKAPQRPLVLEVDLTDAPRRLFHARMVIPVTAGNLTLVYPKWIPGEHMPTGPVVDTAGLVIRAGGVVLPWRRDDVDMFSIRVEVPQGAAELEVTLDLLSPPPGIEDYSAGASATANLAMLSWNTLVLYPAGIEARNLPVVPSVKLPVGWTLSTPLTLVVRTGGDSARTSFVPVSLARLVDSPVLAGAHLREVALGTVDGAPHFLTLAAETAADTELRPEQKAGFEKLVLEAQALFGAHHYESYRFLTSLSDSVAHFGLEHHQSSDDRALGRTLVDPELFMATATLWSHEYVHSWNGKYRRPVGLATTDFQQPMKGELLWVYEGLTEYLGNVLGARSGLETTDNLRELIALEADDMQQHRGRVWRPLEDTAVAAQVLYAARPDWQAWRRGVDFYFEGTLLWLEVDTRIRESTKGAHSLDDFCKRFHGGKSGGPELRPYTLDDVVAALNDVAPGDWRGFLEKRLHTLSPEAPLQGIEASGWRLAYGPERTVYQRASDARRKQLDLRASIGVVVDLRDGKLIDVVPDSPAFRGGLGPAMSLVAVNGRKFSEEVLRTAVARTGSEKLELLVENAETFKSFPLEYAGGARYPHLERIAGRPDVLTTILAPRTGPPPKKAP